MTRLVYEGAELDVATGETVLDALLKGGHEIPHNCRIGVCQSCMMRAVSGGIAAEAQHGLKETLKAQHYFLACQCKPTGALEIMLPAASAVRTTVEVVSTERLSPDVLQLRLRPDGVFDYRAGQYAMLWNAQQLGRCYSLASVPDLDDALEMQIGRVNGGRMTSWLFDEARPGDQLQLQAATGNCFYVAGQPEQNILLAGTGTGLAPLLGIARDALHQGHCGAIHLVHGSIRAQGLYLHDQLLAMAQAYDNFYYHASILEGVARNDDVTVGNIEDLAAQIVPKPKDWKIFLCGAEAMVNLLKKKIFLAGASMANIYSDPFVSTPNSGSTA